MQTPILLLACDLDGTLIPTGPAPDAGDPFGCFARDRRRWELAYVTGRHRALAEEGMRMHGLPEPDWLFCDVGTSLYRWSEGRPVLDENHREGVRAGLGGTEATRIRDLLSGLADLRLQEPERQAEFKTSYTVARGADRNRLRRAVAEALGEGVSQIWSEDPVSGHGLLDLLPAGVTKAHAVDHLRVRRGLPLERVVYAGDSGNDRAALLMGCLGILVGNAPDSLRRELAEEARQLDLTDRLYFARAPYAAGVMEGLGHFALP